MYVCMLLVCLCYMYVLKEAKSRHWIYWNGIQAVVSLFNSIGDSGNQTQAFWKINKCS